MAKIIYGYNVVTSENWIYKKKTVTRLYESQDKCIDDAYEEYKELHKAAMMYGMNGKNLSNKDNHAEQFIHFKVHLLDEFKGVAGVLEFSDSFIQFEYFVTELNVS